ncbi:MAG: glycosyltransferase [Nitrosomonadales bacterium]|nr:glycosyltransferase [Nitrosomonadales bacterium]
MMQASQPLVSVCIPVYNGEKYIAETIQSVLAQTYSKIEILVQDNASTDATVSILRELAANNSRICIERNGQNCGMSANWNRVINRARGDYIMLLSADDLLKEAFVATCLETFLQQDVDVVTTNHLYLSGGRLSRRKTSLASGVRQDYCHLILLLNPFSINFTLFTRDVVNRMRIDGNLFSTAYYTCDYDLWIRLALTNSKISYMDKPLGVYRVHGENLSRQVKRMSRQTFFVLLANKIGLKSRCSVAYRFTLFRFVVRNLHNRFAKGIADNRMLHALLGELVRT